MTGDDSGREVAGEPKELFCFTVEKVCRLMGCVRFRSER